MANPGSRHRLLRRRVVSGQRSLHDRRWTRPRRRPLLRVDDLSFTMHVHSRQGCSRRERGRVSL